MTAGNRPVVVYNEIAAIADTLHAALRDRAAASARSGEPSDRCSIVAGANNSGVGRPVASLYCRDWLAGRSESPEHLVPLLVRHLDARDIVAAVAGDYVAIEAVVFVRGGRACVASHTLRSELPRLLPRLARRGVTLAPTPAVVLNDTGVLIPAMNTAVAGWVTAETTLAGFTAEVAASHAADVSDIAVMAMLRLLTSALPAIPRLTTTSSADIEAVIVAALGD